MDPRIDSTLERGWAPTAVSVVIPFYNERENLAAMIEAIERELPGAHVLIIDDGSPDGTGELADSLAAGAHYLSSDFPAQVKGSGYWCELPGGAPARCNPVAAAAGCTAKEIEALP